MEKDSKKLAFRATLHCVMGCGIGDTLGLAIGTIFSWSTFSTMTLAVVLGFVGGYSLTMIPLLRKGINFKNASKITVMSETASIVVMEAAENGIAFLIPGLLVASFFTPLFWFGLIISVIAGFLAAYPINYFMISKGIRGAHSHH